MRQEERYVEELREISRHPRASQTVCLFGWYGGQIRNSSSATIGVRTPKPCPGFRKCFVRVPRELH